jgi:hypothetical protein
MVCYIVLFNTYLTLCRGALMALVRTLVEEFHHFAAQNQLTVSVLENLKSTSKASDKRADDYPRIIANTRYMFGLGITHNIQHTASFLSFLLF